MKKGIIGVAGEYFVAAELSQMGIVATLTLKNTPSIDILATNLETGKFANIQVKTMSVHNKEGWRLGKKDEEKSNIKNHYYILVNLQGSGEQPEYYVFPQKILAEQVYAIHRKWLSHPKKDGGKRKDTDIRCYDPYRQRDQEEFGRKYKNNWKILKL